METKFAQAKVGLMVVIVLAIIIFTIIWGKGIKLTQEYKPQKIFFNNVLGLEKGAQVLVNGVSKGWVKNFHLRSDGVEADVIIAKEVQLFTDAYAYIETPGVMEEKVVVIVPGASAVPFPEGEMMRGISAMTYSQIYNYLTEIGDNLKLTINEIYATTHGIRRIVDNPQLTKNLYISAENIASASRSMNDLIESSRPVIEKSLGDISSFSSRADQVLDRHQADVDSIFGNLVTLSSELHQSLDNFNQMTFYFRNREGSLGKIVNNDELYQDIRRTTANLDSLIRELRSQGIKTKLKIF